MLDINRVIELWAVMDGKPHTKTELAKKMGVTYRTMANWSNGNTSPRICDLSKIKKITGLEIKMIIE